MKLARRKAASPKLVLTPFIDLLTTLMAFLLISFSPEEAQVKRSPQVKLPAGTLKMLEKIPHLQIEISKDYVLLDGKKVDGVVPEQGVDAGWDHLKTQIQAKVKEPSTPNTTPVLIMADRSTEFRYVDRLSAHLASMGHNSIFFMTQTKALAPSKALPTPASEPKEAGL